MEILGVKVDNLTEKELFERIEQFLTDNEQHYIVTPNPEFLVKAQKDKEFKEIINQADLAVADGIGLVFASRFLGQPIKQRITGVDLMEKVCQKAVQKQWPVFLFGAGQGVAEKTANNLQEKYAGLEILPCIDNNTAGILFVALGAPKQERWIKENLNKMPSIKLAIGVGGAFDFISGRVSRAPKILRKIGLEWLWRLICQPWRAKRIFNAVVVFPWLILTRKNKFHEPNQN